MAEKIASANQVPGTMRALAATIYSENGLLIR